MGRSRRGLAAGGPDPVRTWAAVAALVFWAFPLFRGPGREPLPLGRPGLAHPVAPRRPFPVGTRWARDLARDPRRADGPDVLHRLPPLKRPRACRRPEMGQAPGSWNRYTRAALRLVASATCSSGRPFSSATCRAVSRTYAGSFFLPRCGNRREVGRVGLDEESVEGREPHRLGERLGLLVGHHPGDREMESEVQVRPRRREVPGEAVDDPGPGLSSRRISAHSACASRTWTTSGFSTATESAHCRRKTAS